MKAWILLNQMRTEKQTCMSALRHTIYFFLAVSLVQPKFEYGTTAWYPSAKKEKHQLDMIQRSAARLCLNEYSRESSVSAMISSLQWTSLETRHKMLRLPMMYKINRNLVDVDWTPFLTRPTRTGETYSSFILPKTQDYLNHLVKQLFPMDCHWMECPITSHSWWCPKFKHF